MRRLFCLLALLPLVALGRGPGNHTQDYHQGAKAGQSLATSLSLLAPASVQPSPLFCTAARSLGLLTGSYSCLNGDGTQDSSAGMTLSAVGSPTTQTLAWAPNGNNSTPVSRQRWTTSDSYQTASLSPPAGDFSVCHVGPVSAPLGAVTLVSGPGYSLTVSSAGVATFTSGGASISSASGAVVGGADQLICGTRSGTSGSVYVGTVATSGTVAAPTGNAVLKVGGFVGASRGAFYVSAALSSAQELALDRALVPQAQTASGQAISNSRNSASWVTTSDGTLVALPPGRTGVVGVPGDTTSAVGGLVPAPSRINLLSWSEDFSSSPWAAFFTGTVTANSSTAPDGALTADTIVSPDSTNSNGRFQDVSQTTFASAYTESAWMQAGTVTAGTLQLQVYGGSPNASCTISLPPNWWPRGTCTVSPTMYGFRANSTALTLGTPGTPSTKNGHFYKVTTAGTSAASEPTWCTTGGCTVTDGTAVWTEQGLTRIRASIQVGNGTATAGNIKAFGAQLETGSIASPYCRSESASATCSGDAPTIPTPLWLSTKEGCVAFSLTPTWTGASPSSGSVRVLYGNSAGSAQFGTIINGSTSVVAADGSHAPSVAGGFVVGHRERYATRWSASGNFLRVDNLTTGTMGTPSAFSGFPSFDSVIRIGSNESGLQQPLGAPISNIVFGSTAQGCGSGSGGTADASPGFAAWGDSLTQGTGSSSGNDYLSQAGVRLSGRSIYNSGIGGQTSTQIAARQGGVVPTVSVSGDQIPASGSVAVTSISVALLSTPASTAARTIAGSLAGIPGTLSKDTSDAYSFTRTASGSATSCPPGTPFVVDTSAHGSWAQILWLGRNNYSSPAQVKSDIAAAIASMPSPKRFVVLSILNGNYATEYFGGSDYNTIIQLNQDLAALYPDNFIDVRALLVSHYDPTNPQDVTDHGHDIPPSSLRYDNIHLTDAGYAYVAQAVANFVAGKGW